MNSTPETGVLRETDQEAKTLASRLLREARYATLATLEAETGHPLASRVTIANEMDGTPVILVSELSSHTPALRSDNRCSLLIGEIGKGDPLAHSRMTVLCHAKQLERSSAAHNNARRRFLARHPKAALYVDFGDFHFFRLTIERISLNGGFGKAYALTAGDIIPPKVIDLGSFHEMETGIINHMNEDHADSILNYAKSFGNQNDGSWRMTGIDPQGIDLSSGDETMRIDFPNALSSPEDIRPILVTMAKKAKDMAS